MFGEFLKPKFYKKCKSIVSVMKIRLDIVRKKKNAVYKFLKTDIVDLLNNGHDYNAYIRAEALLEESKTLSCYDFLEQFSDSVIANLSLMVKQSECPEECREAVSSLIYAAARIPEVPELKDLRAVFTERYGNSIESFVNREFVEKLEPRSPSREKKIQTVQEIAQEFSISWDSKALQEMLLGRPSTLQVEQKGQRWRKLEDHKDQMQMDSVKRTGKDVSGDTKREYIQKEKELSSQRRRSYKNNEKKMIKSNSSSDDDDETIWSSRRRESTDLSLWGSSSSSLSRSNSEDESETNVTKKKPLPYRLIPPPYTNPGIKNDEIGHKTKNDDQEDAIIPRSFKQRFLELQGTENVRGTSNNEAPAGGKRFRDSRLKTDSKLKSKGKENGAPRNERSSLFQHPKLPDYDEVVAQVSANRRR